MDIQNLVYTIGAVVLGAIPLLALLFGWKSDKVDQATVYITKLIAAIAVAAAALGGLWLHNNKAVDEKKQTIEAVKTLNATPPEHKEDAKARMGLK